MSNYATVFLLLTYLTMTFHTSPTVGERNPHIVPKNRIASEPEPTEEGSGHHEGGDKENEEGHWEETPFEELSEMFGNHGNNLDVVALPSLVERLSRNMKCEVGTKGCYKCIDVDTLWKRGGAESATRLDENQLELIASVLVYYAANGMKNVCYSQEELMSAEGAREDLFDGGVICQENITQLTERIQISSCPEALRCIDINDVISKGECIDDVESKSRQMMTKIVLELASCKCFLPEKEFFLNELFQDKNTDNGSMTTEGFDDLLIQLEIGSPTTDGEEVEHEHRRKRDVEEDEHDEESDSECYTREELMNIYGIEEQKGITRSQFKELCPSLVQQVATKSCKVEPELVVISDPNYTTAMIYGYGTAAVLIVSALALIGLFMFPALNSSWYKVVMQFFIALGVGTMSGDAILHIIPEVIGLHDHEESSSGHSEEKEEKDFVWKLLTVIGGVYMFYLFESSIRLWNQLKNDNITLHAHQHGSGDHDHSLANGNDRSKHHHILEMSPSQTEEEEVQDPNANNHNCKSENKDSGEQSETAKESTVCGGVSTLVIMVMIGDILHNFGDGIAIGVAFSTSWVSGLATTIAIFCHELPHEFGDFAIYLKNGLTKWKALAVNFAAACTAFVGLYIGISVAENPEIREWMLAIIAGMFLYISLVDVLHEMLEEKTHRPVLQYFLQNLGLLLGWTILLLIALFEENIAAGIGG